MHDGVIEAVCADLQARSAKGIAKYGTTLERADLALRDWLQHAYEEMLDQTNYLKRAIIDMDMNRPSESEEKTIREGSYICNHGSHRYWIPLLLTKIDALRSENRELLKAKQ